MLQCRFELSNPELELFSSLAAGNGVPTAAGLLEKRFGDVPFQRSVLLHIYNGK